MRKLVLSNLGKTWLIDIDGVIFKHNKYLEKNDDTVNTNFSLLFRKIKKEDKVILLTSRKSKFKEITFKTLKKASIKYDQIIFNLPKGERILINDIKPGGLKTAICMNTKRNDFPKYSISYSNKL